MGYYWGWPLSRVVYNIVILHIAIRWHSLGGKFKICRCDTLNQAYCMLYIAWEDSIHMADKEVAAYMQLHCHLASLWKVSLTSLDMNISWTYLMASPPLLQIFHGVKSDRAPMSDGHCGLSLCHWTLERSKRTGLVSWWTPNFVRLYAVYQLNIIKHPKFLEQKMEGNHWMSLQDGAPQL